jgi:asparagine synthetase B (glutamine-hydrolysing)
MFLVALTKDEISQNFENVSLEEFRIHSLVITLVTDKFLSRYINNQNGFSVIETPSHSSPSFDNIIFSQFHFNEKEDTFYLTRNTVAGRPIYYHINSKGEFFCSTHISLLKTAGVPIEEDTTVLPEFFIYRHIMPPKTLFKNIKRMLMGEQIRIRIKNDECVIQPTSYYIPPEENLQISSIAEEASELYQYLTNTFQRIQSLKKETVILLSGGIDSSVLSTIYKKIFSRNTSYSTAYPFETPRQNYEKKYALSAAEALKMDHHYYEPTSQEYLTGFLEAIYNIEEPLHHHQSVLFHLLWKNKIPKEQKIILCAQGAGSTFGNNEIFYFNDGRNKVLNQLIMTRPSVLILKQISKIIERGSELVNAIGKLQNNYPLNHPENPIWSWMDFGNWDWVRNYFNVTKEQIIHDRYKVITRLSQRSMYDLWSRYSLYSDEDVTLAILSKIGEGNKKIIYFPYYDRDVLNCVFSIPWKVKLQAPKMLSKALARQCGIPKFIYTRRKRSLGIIPKRWALKGGVFEPLIPLAAKVINEKEMRKLQSIDSKKAMTYWNILNYSIWKRLIINNEPIEVLQEEIT